MGLLTWVGAGLSCHLPSAEPEPPTPVASGVEISPPACNRYAGPARDADLQGSPWRAETTCCESDFGFNPALVVSGCGFRKYLGESEELACVHRFEDAGGQLREFRLTPIIDLGFEAAIALHEQGEFDESHQAGPAPNHPTLWISTSDTRHWALIPGWTATRRLTWERPACDTADMLPVLAAMASAPPPIDEITPLPRLELDPTSDSPVDPTSLLARLATTPIDTQTRHRHPLPRAATDLINRTLHAAATNDLAAFTSTVSPTARWGLPDRRQLSARAILSDGGNAAMTALRQSAHRLSAQLELHCPQIDRRMVPAVRTGNELMWCVWASADALDLLVFGLRGHIVEGQADATIEYLGLFPHPPSNPLKIPGEPPPPPARPKPTIICGDPHAVDYPGQCPETEMDDDDDDDGDDNNDNAHDNTPPEIEYGR